MRHDLQQRAGHVHFINNLAQTLSDQGRNAEALALLDRAGNPEPRFAAAVAETRALVLQRLDKAK